MARTFHKVLSASNAGFTFMLIVGGTFYLGVLADEHFDSSPALTLLGFLVGFAAGFYQLTRSILGPTRADGGKGSETSTQEEDPGT